MEIPNGGFREYEVVEVDTTSMQGGQQEKVVRRGTVTVLTPTFIIVEVNIPGYRRIHVVRYRTGNPASPFEGIRHALARAS